MSLIALAASNYTLANSSISITSLEQAAELNEKVLVEKVNSNAKLELLKKQAQSLGAQIGSRDAEVQLNALLLRLKSSNDKVYSYKKLGLTKQVKGVFLINPVIEEVQEQVILGPDKKSFQVRGKTLTVAEEPYFSNKKPNWESSLLVDVTEPKISSVAAVPTNDEEKQIWKDNLKKGYDFGFNAAQDALEERIVKLTNQIVGMNLYEILVDRKVLLGMEISESLVPVSGGGYQMDIQNTSVEINVNPSLNSDTADWASIPSLFRLNKSTASPYKFDTEEWR